MEASGKSCLSSFICSDMGVRSEVPVTFPPGASFEATRPLAAGSVTAERTMGISFVMPATAWAAGVAIA